MLKEIYENYRTKAAAALSEELASCFHPPILVQPPASWAAAEHRIAFVGQETREWSWTQDDASHWRYEWPHTDINSLADFRASEQATVDLMQGYAKFDFGRIIPRLASSPFWRYFADVRGRVEASGKPTSIIFSNLIRCASNDEQGFTLWTIGSEDRDRYLAWQQGLLMQELRELKPTLILFVTGPAYDEYLKAEFPGIGFEALAPFNVRQLARLTGDGLPAPAYRTYHPGFLNRNLGFKPLDVAIDHASSGRG